MSLYDQSLKDSAKQAGHLLASRAANAMPGNGQADAAKLAINARLAQIHAQVNDLLWWRIDDWKFLIIFLFVVSTELWPFNDNQLSYFFCVLSVYI